MTARQEVFSGFEAFRPPKRMSVAEAAAQNFHIRQPGGYTGQWSAEEAPYMVEPMNMLASRRHEAVCFVGPARSGKTIALGDGFMVYAVTCDPGDMLIVQMSQEKAREYSKTRIDRAIRHSPALRALMSISAQDDNTHDKMWKHGAWLRIGWPTVTQLSGSDYRYVVCTDYDRVDDDIGGEGSLFGMALKRTQVALSRGMCAVESSPGRELTDPNWSALTKHEAPPCSGILGIYNRSDRRRFYWRCVHCEEFFEAAPGLDLFGLPDETELLEAVRHADLDEIASQYARVVCPRCGALIDKAQKHNMNLGGRWLGDGQIIHANGKIEGELVRSSIAGFWLGGVAAAYQSWHSIVMRYLQGLREYALAGSEETLKNTVNLDQGMPYMSMLLKDAKKKAAGPESRKDQKLERFIVPDLARFLIATVDVQGGQGARFIVQVHAVGLHMEMWPVDRFTIKDSKREGADGNAAPIDPASYGEDWDVLRDLVLNATWRLSDEGKEMRVKLMVVDSGGESGVTDKAYAFYRRMRAQQYAPRVMLIKGASTKNAPIIKESWVGGKNKGEKGDIPLYILNPNHFKDGVAASLKREAPGPGYMHIPSWLPQWWFDELNAEVRKPDGTWMQIRARNEAFDLIAYARAGCVKLGADRPAFWANPPDWARPLWENSMVITREMRRELQAGTTETTAVMRRRAVRSSYIK